ncbi:MAG: hypothetical protein WCD69_16730, partial [Xanthobacteraceae bacterium]
MGKKLRPSFNAGNLTLGIGSISVSALFRAKVPLGQPVSDQAETPIAITTTLHARLPQRSAALYSTAKSLFAAFREKQFIEEESVPTSVAETTPRAELRAVSPWADNPRTTLCAFVNFAQQSYTGIRERDRSSRSLSSA